MSHDHHHHHSSGSNALTFAFFLNLGFSLIELVGGILTNSTAIVADAFHDFRRNSKWNSFFQIEER